MNSEEFKKITKDGLWKNNPALVQVLGLCPLLAVSGSVVNALALALATAAVLTLSNLAVSLIRNATTDAIRLPTFVMIIAAFTTCIEFLMNAFTYELYLILGIFIPLIVTNCIVLGRADAFASKNPPLAAVWDGLMMGLGFGLVLVLLGAVRELLGTGALFNNMDLLFGDIASNWRLELIPGYRGFLIAILPPGAFIVLGFLMALKNIIDARVAAAAKANKEAVTAGSKRVRTTGNIA
ncbi:electron transport complex subunit E [Ketobacter sp. MCCC 1A13808]|uniref:electron transport complex subunit E n=1 Tax=Ketobacter sp. MCCC 1A13808 TaxID=2602738 RepID=UPI000F18A776|nr:electron transport complex subunit E [Ketobacter sp. MCCC 1A13808]MVF10801.1 electron transport complex subunit E [Ketobacter sp. MCCC 1A13808]RLP56212.1 MAG: electron transport complex subunit E [Ketobacter sp.]